MKVLKNNFIASQPDYNPIVEVYPKKFICEKCKSELLYEKSDIRIGEYGCAVVDCPLCGYENYLDEEGDITLTMDNIEFPTHFHHVSTETGAVDRCDNEHVKKYIYEAINYLRSHRDEHEWGGHITGNLYLNVSKLEGDEMYDITVSNDFYNSFVKFESEDY